MCHHPLTWPGLYGHGPKLEREAAGCAGGCQDATRWNRNGQRSASSKRSRRYLMALWPARSVGDFELQRQPPSFSQKSPQGGISESVLTEETASFGFVQTYKVLFATVWKTYVRVSSSAHGRTCSHQPDLVFVCSRKVA